MIDSNLIQSISYLDSIDKLIESSLEKYLNPETILSVLQVDYSDINNLLFQQAKQATNCLYYNSIAAKINGVLRTFEDAVLEPYLAHCRRYAGIYLDSMDKRRATKESLNDFVILMFSGKADKNLYAISCYEQTWKEANKGGSIEAHRESEGYGSAVKKFYTEMYSLGKTYEEVMEIKNKFKYRKELAESLAESFKQLTICASNVVKLRLMGSGETPKVSQDVVNNVYARKF